MKPFSKMPKRDAAALEADEPAGKCAAVADDTESRYIAGNDISPRRIHLPTLRKRSPACRLLRDFDSGKGMTPDDPVYLSAPLWFVQAIADYAQVFSPRVLTCPGVDETLIADVLVAFGYAGAGDFCIAKEVNSVVKHLMPKTPTEQLRIATKELASTFLRLCFQSFGHYQLAGDRLIDKLVDRSRVDNEITRSRTDRLSSFIALENLIKQRPIVSVYQKWIDGVYLRFMPSLGLDGGQTKIMLSITKQDWAPASRVDPPLTEPTPLMH